MKRRNIIRAFPACFFVMFLLACIIANKRVVKIIYTNYKNNNVEYAVDNAEGTLQESIVGKTVFFVLNGLMTASLGINSLNTIQKLSNGWLANEEPHECDVETVVEDIRDLSTFLKNNHIEYICMPVGGKNAFYDVKFKQGHAIDEKDTYQSLIQGLSENKVNYLDMNTWYQNNGWKMEDVYFKTDHHWRPEAAWQATKCLIENLYQCGIIQNNTSIYEKNKWNFEVYRDWFLGSEGKRTGTKYAGTDDLCYVYPKFDTDITVHRFYYDKENRTGNNGSVYETHYLNQKNYFSENSYCLYLGGNFSLTYIQNNAAQENKKVMVIGDSYRLPVECFLSAIFKEIYHVDMRAYEEGTFIELVQEIKPDIVMIIFTTPDVDTKLKFGIDDWKQNYESRQKEEQFHTEEIKLEETKAKNNFKVVYSNIVDGSYEVDVQDVILERNSEINSNDAGGCVQFSLMDLQTGQVVKSRYFLSDYETPQKWLFTVPKNKNANYAIVVYNGMFNDTYGNTTKISNISISHYQ